MNLLERKKRGYRKIIIIGLIISIIIISWFIANYQESYEEDYYYLTKQQAESLKEEIINGSFEAQRAISISDDEAITVAEIE
jgi:hypothetical protein